MLFKLPLQQTIGMVWNLLRFAGPGWPVPYCSALCCRQRILKVQIPYCRAYGHVNDQTTALVLEGAAGGEGLCCTNRLGGFMS